MVNKSGCPISYTIRAPPRSALFLREYLLAWTIGLLYIVLAFTKLVIFYFFGSQPYSLKKRLTLGTIGRGLTPVDLYNAPQSLFPLELEIIEKGQPKEQGTLTSETEDADDGDNGEELG